ncbi:hypothetical protein FUAX_40740 (plasmid) [Fulvitalea axinellae]|uniref:Uncharacterized protein n=1 Tax=Fulvitalea axinellae TaxID=1182444 RepID=A0AAU9CKX9_9BACT|nr:hypothetical protein FUAX_32900 [Fulvitalea axinellae]BDD11642.1 hypothetical protein FUAX_40740 [Fulvitalea axinellae]
MRFTEGIEMKEAEPLDKNRDSVATFDDLLTLEYACLGIEVKVKDQAYKKYVWFRGAQDQAENWKVASGEEEFHYPIEFIATNLNANILAETDFEVLGTSESDNVTDVRVYLDDALKTSFPFDVAKGKVVRVGVTTTEPDGISLVNLKCKRK